MVRIYLSATILFLFLSACAAIPHKQLDGNPAFSPHQYSSSDMDVSWKSEKQDNALRIDGILTNVRENSVYDSVELEATLLDSQGKVLAKNTYHFTPVKLKGSESFKMTIPLEGNSQPDRIKFNYRYGIEDDRYSVKFESKP
ncbi:MAG: hypothetical protein A2X79_03820 [Desulfuromonadaceae bacterium GWB2_53_15]|nr:MAG: hypothetical protein A2X83_10200 [Desulfuromonadales bacterium GWD2_54_10]OHB30819.1 MAG: hypothetical protein A2X79_03820 [Desulfuromonadaceae bacterium GWB2_53_15]